MWLDRKGGTASPASPRPEPAWTSTTHFFSTQGKPVLNAPYRADTAPRLSPAEIRSIIIGLVAAMLLAALDQTIVATAMPTIGLELGDAANLPWIVTAYLLASTAVTPLYGKLSDIHGRRIMLLIAITTFSVGSLLCALAPTMIALALARGLQGIGGGGLIALSQIILADILSAKERARYQVYIAGVFALSSVAGPCSAASSPSTCTGRRSSGSTCRSGLLPSSSPTTSSSSCPATNGGTASIIRARRSSS